MTRAKLAYLLFMAMILAGLSIAIAEVVTSYVPVELNQAWS